MKKKTSWEFKMTLGVAVAFAAFIVLMLMFGPDTLASGQCPASPGDIQGQADCGELTCDLFRSNSTYVMGGTCSPRRKFYCCANGGPFMARESVDGIAIEFVERGNRPFDGLTNGVHVRMLVNDGVVDHGRFVDGYLTMKSGTKYLVLAGDLFRVAE